MSVQKITPFQKRMMKNWFVQFFKFLYLNLRILHIVAGGHGSTRKKD